MFTFALAFFAGHQYYFSLFSTCLCFSRKEEEGICNKHSQQKPLTTTTTCVRRRVSNWSLCLLCSILFIFSKRKCISKSWRKLMNYKPENRIPWLFTDFDNIKDFSWLFLYVEKFSFFPNFSLTVATLIYQKLNKKLLTRSSSKSTMVFLRIIAPVYSLHQFSTVSAFLTMFWF